MSIAGFDAEAEAVRIRRALHRIPELGFNEHRTSDFIVRYLVQDAGFDPDDVMAGVAGTGVVALIRSDVDPERKCVAIRADMDGLPIQEQSNVEYKSVHEGVMHACGHDAHVAMLLVAARILNASRDFFFGTVKLLFQPAEESPGGAKPMIDAGVLENPHVDFVFGAHVWNYCRPGEIQVCVGPLMASSDKFRIQLSGHGGHGAQPEGTTDCVVATASLIQQLHSIVARNVSPTDSAVLTIGTVHSGYNYNVIADGSDLTGTVRSFKNDVRQTVIDRMHRICKGIGQSFEVEVQLDYQAGYPATINTDEQSVNMVKQCCSKVHPVVLPIVQVMGSGSVKEARPVMGAEDFSYFLQARPGCFFFIGSAPHRGKEIVPHHKSCFDIDESCLNHGLSIWVELVRQVLS